MYSIRQLAEVLSISIRRAHRRVKHVTPARKIGVHAFYDIDAVNTMHLLIASRKPYKKTTTK
jgi:hypothetical protein